MNVWVCGYNFSKICSCACNRRQVLFAGFGNAWRSQVFNWDNFERNDIHMALLSHTQLTENVTNISMYTMSENDGNWVWPSSNMKQSVQCPLTAHHVITLKYSGLIKMCGPSYFEERTLSRYLRQKTVSGCTIIRSYIQNIKRMTRD